MRPCFAQERLLLPATLYVLSVTAPIAKAVRGSARLPYLRYPSARKQVAFVFIATLCCNNAVYRQLHLGLGNRPSDSFLFGSLLLIMAVGCVPAQIQAGLVQNRIDRLLYLGGAGGLLLLFLEPPLPLQACLWKLSFARLQCA